MNRNQNVRNMQLTIANCMKQEWGITYSEVSDLLEKYGLLEYMDICYEKYNSMGIKGILLDLQGYIDALKEKNVKNRNL